MNLQMKVFNLAASALLVLCISCDSYRDHKLAQLWNVVTKESDIEKLNRSWSEIVSIKSVNNIEYIANCLIMTQEVGREGKPIYLDGVTWLQELVPITYEFNGKIFMSDKEYRNKIREIYLTWLRENRSRGPIEFDSSKRVFVGKQTTEREIQTHRDWMRIDKHWH